MHPSHHVPKTYLAKVKGKPEPAQLERMAAGVRLREPDGGFTRRTKPADVRIFQEGRANTWIELTITEGRNHQVKRMCEAVGLWVVRLIRTEFAGISIDPLPAGAWRLLTAAEIETLRNWV
jgi:23S rRNA pseudouridine2605 synthase